MGYPDQVHFDIRRSDAPADTRRRRVTFRPELYWWIATPFLRRLAESKFDRHEFHELIYVGSGSGCIQINRTKHQAATGDLFLLNPGDRHREGTDHPGDFGLHYLAFRCAGSWERIVKGVLGKPAFPHIIREATPLLYDLFHAMQPEIVNRVAWHETMISLHIDMFLFKLLRLLQHDESSSKPQPMSPRSHRQLAGRIAELIRQNPRAHLSVDEMAEHCYLSRSYFSKVFRDETGQSPARFVLGERMKHARELLLESDEKILAVANRLGFEDEFHFSRVFKRLVGVSPSKYRKRK